MAVAAMRHGVEWDIRYQLVAENGTVLDESEFYSMVALKADLYPGSRIKTIRLPERRDHSTGDGE